MIILLSTRDSEEQYNKPRHTQGKTGSDHNPVISTLRVKLKKVKKPKTTPKLNYDTLSSDPDIKEAYRAGVMKMLKANTNGKLQQDLFREALVKTAREVIPKKEKKSKNKWITPDILELMKKRQKVTDKYNHRSRSVLFGHPV